MTDPQAGGMIVVVGLMSGTSLDGVDLCCARFDTSKLEDFEILAAETRPYPKAWRSRLKDAFQSGGVDSDRDLQDLLREYGEYLGDLVKDFIASRGIERVDLLCSHGHTIHHKPDEGVTTQIGCGGRINEVTGIRTVSNFREQDVVQYGGQGAPLVPIGDALLFKSHDVCLNLGGIANLSFHCKGEDKRLAFDIVPVNLVLNHFASKIDPKAEYDDGGAHARAGKLNEALFRELNALSFYQQKGPKSLGYEFVAGTILPMLEDRDTDKVDGALDARDVLRTFTEHIAHQIGRTLNATGLGDVLVTGGGAYNDYLLERLRARTDLRVCVPDKDIVEYKEALIFGLLGVLRVRGINNCLASVTGARYDHCRGDVYG